MRSTDIKKHIKKAEFYLYKFYRHCANIYLQITVLSDPVCQEALGVFLMPQAAVVLLA